MGADKRSATPRSAPLRIPILILGRQLLSGEHALMLAPIIRGATRADSSQRVFSLTAKAIRGMSTGCGLKTPISGFASRRRIAQRTEQGLSGSTLVGTQRPFGDESGGRCEIDIDFLALERHALAEERATSRALWTIVRDRLLGRREALSGVRRAAGARTCRARPPIMRRLDARPGSPARRASRPVRTGSA